jgi:hypothetical protein
MEGLTSGEVKVKMTIEIPAKLAVQIVNETNCLVVSKYPALGELAVAIAKELNTCEEIHEVIVREVENPENPREKTGFLEVTTPNETDSPITVSQGTYSEGTGTTTINIMPAIDIMHLPGEQAIVKVRCQSCKMRNPKDARQCEGCRCVFYKDEKEYLRRLKTIEKLEKQMQSSTDKYGMGSSQNVGLEKTDSKEEVSTHARSLICPVCREEISGNYTQIVAHFDCANKIYEKIQ